MHSPSTSMLYGCGPPVTVEAVRFAVCRQCCLLLRMRAGYACAVHSNHLHLDRASRAQALKRNSVTNAARHCAYSAQAQALTRSALVCRKTTGQMLTSLNSRSPSPRCPLRSRCCWSSRPIPATHGTFLLFVSSACCAYLHLRIYTECAITFNWSVIMCAN